MQALQQEGHPQQCACHHDSLLLGAALEQVQGRSCVLGQPSLGSSQGVGGFLTTQQELADSQEGTGLHRHSNTADCLSVGQALAEQSGTQWIAVT
jgi:hypothetical protein